MLVGLIITALGLASCALPNLGMSPVATLPFAVNQIVPKLSLGTAVFIQHVVFFLLTALLLRKDFKLFQILQLPCSFLFGYFVDLWELLLRELVLDTYFSRALVFLFGCVVSSLGFSLIYLSKVALEANTAFVTALSLRAGKPYGTIKTLTDVFIVLLSAVLSLVFLHTIAGIREGTVIAALIIGPIAGFFNKHLAKYNGFFTHDIL